MLKSNHGKTKKASIKPSWAQEWNCNCAPDSVPVVGGQRIFRGGWERQGSLEVRVIQGTSLPVYGPGDVSQASIKQLQTGVQRHLAPPRLLCALPTWGTDSTPAGPPQ